MSFRRTGAPDSYDAVVVGARCAGAATAMLLARAGLRVLALDRSLEASDTLSTHALMRGGVLQLQRWGVLERVLRAGTPAVTRTTFHYGDETFPVDIKPSAGVEALFAPRRTVLDAALVAAAREAGVHVVHRAPVIGLLRDRGGRVIGVETTGARGVPRRVHAEIVIGADGMRSAVARLTGAATLRETTHRAATLYAYFDGLELDGYHWHYVAGASAGAIPTNSGASTAPRACVFASLPPQRFKDELLGLGPDRLFRAVLGEAAPRLAEQLAGRAPVGNVYPFGGAPGFLRQAHGPGWALVGDAGYFKDPLTAHGITDALRDAELLARAVVDGELDTYQDVRDALSTELLLISERIASFDWDLPTVQALHKTLSREMQREVEVLCALERPANPIDRPTPPLGIRVSA